MNLSGSPLDFLWAFFGGVLVSFTPCVYPLLPITVAYIGAASVDSRIKGFTLSLIYVAGISITYAILGLVAVLTGSIFGQFSSLPLVRIIAGIIIVIFGFALWTDRGFKLPVFKLPLLKKPGNYLSCFILGMASGLVISPCTAPVLGSILVFVATQRNFVYGALLLFSFAYGMGLLLILAGTFSSILAALPKSGRWMEVIRKIYAIILIVAGVYFVFSGGVNLAYAQEAETIVPKLDFCLKDLNGDIITLSEYKGDKPVVLYFWTTWCVRCVRRLNKLNQFYPSLVSDNIEVLAVNVGESKSKVRRFLKSNPLSFKVLLDEDSSIARSYGLVGVPIFVLVTKAGQVVFKNSDFPRDSYRDYLLSEK
jgi:thiol:disulfide interchange protein DsbD